MKKLLTLTLALILTLSVCACTADDPDVPAVTTDGVSDTVTDTDTAVESSFEETTELPESTEESTDISLPFIIDEESGLVVNVRCNPAGSGSHYSRVFDCWFYSPSQTSLILEDENPTPQQKTDASEAVKKWMKDKYGADLDDWLTMHRAPTWLHFIKDFNIPKERMERYMLKGRLNAFNSEMLDALYSDDVTDLYKFFLNPNAIAVGEKVYTPRMLHTMTYSEMIAAGITAEQIEAKMPYWGYYLFYCEFYPDMIKLCEENGIEYEESQKYRDFLLRGENFYKRAEYEEPEYMHYFDEE